MNNRIADGRVKFRHLQCFLAVAQLGGVQKAAESLSITQPAVSKTIAELEAILGVKLFERGRQGAQPTREAQLFMPHANACVLALRQGVGLLAREGGAAAATLEIGMLPTVAASLAPALMKALAERWPRIVVRIATAANADLLERLKSGAIECAIGRLSEPERMIGLAFEQLYNEPLVAVVRAGHPLLSNTAPATELARYPVVLPPYGTLIRQSAEQLLGTCGVPPLDSFIEVLSVSVARALALENDAVWFVPLYAAEYDLSAGALARLPLPSAGTDEPVGLILRTDAQPSPVARTLIDAVRDIARSRFGDKRPHRTPRAARKPGRGDR
ncbi:pca operon transcription factor PcaQ [Burkholderia pyrrocinia]|uniref:pca operon transcription factor PcaQ n=1 Tax=Burkholderia sp. IT-111MI5 TaxID=3026439 RepID=UPI002A329A4B|nr:pca operon transcription factor PcaQ [Burkholderia pyrrocinia]EKS9891817.1 pca operon transcription factor PcaQ [Burkholderia pyrrocinia]EKS9905289.1 pca operon transcription factor PcaQ [Burkholderia pyrrocinia]